MDRLEQFDHCPMILSQYADSHVKRPFIFCNMWTKAQNFMTLVLYNWEKLIQGCKMFKVIQKLKWLKNYRK